MLNPPTQYATDANLRARQRFWQHQERALDLVGWVLDVAQVRPGMAVVDIGCGNGAYLARLADMGVDAVGCDISPGMAAAARRQHPHVMCGDAQRTPLRNDAFDVVLAPHMLYHVDDRTRAAREMRRVLRPGGRGVVVTNGAEHMRALREVIEEVVGETNPGWEMRNPSTHVFSLENGAEVLEPVFSSVRTVRPEGVSPVTVRDATVVADYVASVADHYQHDVDRPWAEVVEDVRARVEAVIAADGAFTVSGETGAFVCT